MAVWWLSAVVPLESTALLPLVVLPLLGTGTVRSVAASYADPVIFLFLGGFLLAATLERWELHRVYVVEATLKPGMRHVYSKRHYYLDEDTFGAGLYDAWDQEGNLYRSMFLSGVQLYDKQIPYAVKNVIYDFNKGMYGVINDGLKGGFKIPKEALPERQMNAEAIVSRITQR